MTTAQDVLDYEGARLGQGGNETWAWYPLAPGTAWCCAFQSMCLTACGIPTRFAWVSALFDDYRSRNATTTDIRSAEPGMLVAFEWGSTPGGYDHVAMILERTATGCWTRNGNVNGSRVADLWFPFDGGGMAELAMPAYNTPTPPAPTPIPQGAEMVRFIRPQSSPKVFLVDAEFVGGAIHARDEQALKDLNWALSNTPGVSIAAPPAGAQVDTVAGVPVWVVSDAFATTIGIA